MSSRTGAPTGCGPSRRPDTGPAEGAQARPVGLQDDPAPQRPRLRSGTAPNPPLQRSPLRTRQDQLGLRTPNTRRQETLRIRTEFLTQKTSGWGGRRPRAVSGGVSAPSAEIAGRAARPRSGDQYPNRGSRDRRRLGAGQPGRRVRRAQERSAYRGLRHFDVSTSSHCPPAPRGGPRPGGGRWVQGLLPPLCSAAATAAAAQRFTGREVSVRGVLRVYLGAAPGVGKTHAMLAEGRLRCGRGADVVIAFVEDYGRPLTRR
ncbi:hypothetical protein ACIQFW_33860, partial [Streptomyces ardesiacus]